jgi:hypothetical protein
MSPLSIVFTCICLTFSFVAVLRPTTKRKLLASLARRAPRWRTSLTPAHVTIRKPHTLSMWSSSTHAHTHVRTYWHVPHAPALSHVSALMAGYTESRLQSSALFSFMVALHAPHTLLEPLLIVITYGRSMVALHAPMSLGTSMHCNNVRRHEKTLFSYMRAYLACKIGFMMNSRTAWKAVWVRVRVQYGKQPVRFIENLWADIY